MVKKHFLLIIRCHYTPIRMSELRMPTPFVGRMLCGHSAPYWFKNSISNLTQIKLFLGEALKSEERRKQECQT